MGPEGMRQGREIKNSEEHQSEEGVEDRTGMGGETAICKNKGRRGGGMSDWYGDNQRKAK